MRIKPFDSERDLAKQVIAWLADQQWEVFQEVQVLRGSNVADIVARRDGILWVIECKLSFGFAVIDQAFEWRDFAHYTSVATPSARGRSAFVLLRHLGIGQLSVGLAEVHEEIAPRLNRNSLTKHLADALREEHKTWAEAGNATGDHYSPFKSTCRDVLRAVEKQPGITMKELIDKTPTHYHSTATARSALAKWIQLGKVAGVESRREGRHLKLYPANAQP